jgi:hypothetical protein
MNLCSDSFYDLARNNTHPVINALAYNDGSRMPSDTARQLRTELRFASVTDGFGQGLFSIVLSKSQRAERQRLTASDNPKTNLVVIVHRATISDSEKGGFLAAVESTHQECRAKLYLLDLLKNSRELISKERVALCGE